MDRERVIATVAAIVGWAGLALQLVLIVDSLGLALGLWRLVGFFTILTNIGAAVVASAIALNAGRLRGDRARLMVATSIITVGIVYSIALRALWNPTGLSKVVDFTLHDGTPLLWLLLWLTGPAVNRSWREIGWALLPPGLYAAYALARGAVDGWYAYWFLDPNTRSIGELTGAVGIMICGIAAVAAVLIELDRWRARRRSV